jgi:hypothetical protein
MEKLGPPYTPDGNLKWHSHFGKYMAVPQKDKHSVTN